MKLQTKIFWPALIAAAVALPLMAQEAPVAQPAAAPAAAEPVGSETCVACHADQAASYKTSMHGKKMALGGKPDQSCESCHGKGSLHAAAGGDKTNPGFSTIKNAGKLSPRDGAKMCFSCHKQKDLMGWDTGAHAQSGMNCTKCHSVHDGKGAMQLKKSANETCYGCHKKQKADGKLPSHHPVNEGKMQCVSCHSAHGGHASSLKAETVNETCYKCHAEKSGPMAYEHPPVTESCSTCHKPHGSSGQSLLKQAQPALCLRCHKWPHVNRTAGYNGDNALTPQHISQRGRCTDCHREIHGSDRHAAFKN